MVKGIYQKEEEYNFGYQTQKIQMSPETMEVDLSKPLVHQNPTRFSSSQTVFSLLLDDEASESLFFF